MALFYGLYCICKVNLKIVCWQELDRVGCCLFGAGTILGTFQTISKDYKIKLLYRGGFIVRGRSTNMIIPSFNKCKKPLLQYCLMVLFIISSVSLPYSWIAISLEESRNVYGIFCLISFAVISTSIHALSPNYLIACLVSGYYAALCLFIGYVMFSLFGLSVQTNTSYLPFESFGSICDIFTEILESYAYIGMLFSILASVFGIPGYLYRDSRTM